MNNNKGLILEFNENSSIKDILKELLYYKDNGVLAKVTINNRDVYSDSEDLKKELLAAYYNISMDEVNNNIERLKELRKKQEDLLLFISDIESVMGNYAYKFYIELSLEYIIGNKRETFINHIIRNYSPKEGERIMRYFSQIVVALEKENVRLELLNVFQNVRNEDERNALNNAIYYVLSYGENSKVLRQALHSPAVSMLYENNIALLENTLSDIEELDGYTLGM